MKLFGIRVVSGPRLDTIIKEHNKSYYKKQTRKDLYHNFFTENEKQFLSCVYMTVYENQKGKQYVMFSKHLPQPGGIDYSSIDSLIGATTGYNTKVVSCEKCYIIG